MWRVWWLLQLGAPEPRLEWDAPPSCPTASELAHRISQHASPAAVAELRVHGRVTAGDDGRLALELRIETHEGTALREIGADDCGALTDAAALMIGIAAQGRAPPTEAADPVGLPEPPPAAEPGPSPAPASDPIAPVGEDERTTPTARDDRRALPPSPARRRDRRPRGVIEIAGGLDAVAVPGVGGTVLAHAGLHWPRLRVHGLFTHAIVRTVGERPSARHRMLAGGLELCGLGSVGAWALGACGSAEGGRLHAQGRGGVGLRARAVPWLAVAVGPRVERSLGRRFVAFAAVSVVVPLVRRRFTVGDRDVGVVALPGVRAVVGAAVRL